jgi:hypothetical protein
VKENLTQAKTRVRNGQSSREDRVAEGKLLPKWASDARKEGVAFGVES